MPSQLFERLTSAERRIQALEDTTPDLGALASDLAAIRAESRRAADLSEAAKDAALLVANQVSEIAPAVRELQEWHDSDQTREIETLRKAIGDQERARVDAAADRRRLRWQLVGAILVALVTATVSRASAHVGCTPQSAASSR